VCVLKNATNRSGVLTSRQSATHSFIVGLRLKYVDQKLLHEANLDISVGVILQSWIVQDSIVNSHHSLVALLNSLLALFAVRAKLQYSVFVTLYVHSPPQNCVTGKNEQTKFILPRKKRVDNGRLQLLTVSFCRNAEYIRRSEAWCRRTRLHICISILHL